MQSRKVGTIDFYCTYLEVILYLLVEYIWPWYTFDIVLGKMLHLFSFFLSFFRFFLSFTVSSSSSYYYYFYFILFFKMYIISPEISIICFRT